jgi:ribosomal protein S27AE
VKSQQWAEQNRDRVNETHRRSRDPKKASARTILNRAVRSGAIVRRQCERCGEMKTEAHHTDYSRPLDVLWLCKPCHGIEHRKYAD